MDDETAAALSDRYRAPALDKGLDILEVLAEQPSGLTRAEIVKLMGRSPSEIYRMLERLVGRDYVTRIDGDRYALSMKLFLLAHRHPPLRRMIAQAQPLMDAFALETRQACHLVMREHNSAVVMAQASPSAPWEFRVRIGAEIGLFDTGSGLTLLAFQNPEKRLETLTQWGARDAAAQLAPVEDELRRVRQAGYRVAPSSQLVGVVDLSLPILDLDGDAIAALTCAFIQQPGLDHDHDAETALAKLRAVAALLSFSRLS